MSMNRVAAITLGNINANTLTGGWDVLYAGLSEACSIFRIVNTSNRSIEISYDGVNAHDFVVTGTTLQLSFQANNRPGSNIALLAKNTIVYVRGAVGTGIIYCGGYYTLID